MSSYEDIFGNLSQENINEIPYEEIQHYISAGKKLMANTEASLKSNYSFSDSQLKSRERQQDKRKSILKELERRYTSHPEKNRSKDKEIKRIKDRYSLILGHSVEDISDAEINLLGYDDLVYVINKLEPEAKRAHNRYANENSTASRAGVYNPFLDDIKEKSDKLKVMLKRLEDAKSRTPEGKKKIQVSEWIKAGKCRFCGGDLKGFFTKTCKICGEEK